MKLAEHAPFNYRPKLSDLFLDAAKYYISQNIIRGVELYQNNDVHAYIALPRRLSNFRMIHLYGNPRLCSHKTAVVSARIVNESMIRSIRASEPGSLGHEEGAVIDYLNGFGSMPWDKDFLVARLSEEVPELGNSRA